MLACQEFSDALYEHVWDWLCNKKSEAELAKHKRHCYLFHPSAHKLAQYLHTMAKDSGCHVIFADHEWLFRNLIMGAAYTWPVKTARTMFVIIPEITELANYAEKTYGAEDGNDRCRAVESALKHLSHDTNVLMITTGSDVHTRNLDRSMFRRLEFRSFCPIPDMDKENEQWRDYIQHWGKISGPWP